MRLFGLYVANGYGLWDFFDSHWCLVADTLQGPAGGIRAFLVLSTTRHDLALGDIGFYVNPLLIEPPLRALLATWLSTNIGFAAWLGFQIGLTIQLLQPHAAVGAVSWLLGVELLLDALVQLRIARLHAACSLAPMIL